MPFPGWDEFEGPDSADLDDAAKQAIASAAIPVPEGVTRGVIRLADERRYGVPVALVCPEFTPAQAREWVEQGEVPELAKARTVSFIDIDSGHWPMVSAPAELARVLSQAAESQPYTIEPLDSSTWAVFAELVERNNGVFGGCWCMGYHPDDSRDAARNRAAKEHRVRAGRAHAALVVDQDGSAQGWCQYGSPEELLAHQAPARVREGRSATRGLADHLPVRRQEAPRSGRRAGRAGGRARPDRPISAAGVSRRSPR